MSGLIALLIAAVVVIVLLASTLKTVDQAHVAVVTVFGKYRRVLNPGLNVLIPFVEKIYRRVPIQNQTAQLQFAAITNDQAAVHFTSTIIFTVSDHDADTVQKVAFSFVTEQAFGTAMTAAVEASVREFVATKVQGQVLGLRLEIVDHAKHTLAEQLASWGYRLVDLTVNDIKFDAEVMSSMSRVVAAKNAKTAAEFEGDALRIQKTKEAEAAGAAIKIQAENEAEAARLRGEGLANFRKAIASGLSESAAVLKENDIDPSMLAFTMWTETVRDAAKEGKGNVLFLDGGVDAMDSSMKRLQGMLAHQDKQLVKENKD
jgi:prepilin-type processing-associated H-X9-DG protein